jgi:hypothetical protein
MKTEFATASMSPHTPDEPRLGVDIGRVIIAGDGPDTSVVGGSEDAALRAPSLPRAFEALARLHRLYDGRVWLVSKCGPRVQARTRAWLAHHRFFASTGIDPAKLVFCLKRPEKAPICARLGITCFIDDRPDVLESMRGVVPIRLLFGALAPSGPAVIPVADWTAAERAATSASTGRIPD